MERTSSSPEIRVRVNHSRTIKEGWRHETTVEVNHDDEIVLLAELERILIQADEVARRETERRNALDRGEDLP